MAKKTQNDLENSDPLPNSGVVEWPCKPTAESSGWPSSWPNDSSKSKLQTPLPTAEDEAANKAQLPALLAISEYLKSTLTLDDDEDDFSEYITDDEDDFDSEDEEEEGFKDYDFFVKLFKEDDGLREYYETNRDNGEFCCLVCCGVREKGWKRFKNCGALVQHAVSIAKTKKRRAHRAYCQVVCEILGWDVNRLPSIVLSACDKPVKAEGNADDDGGEDCLSGQCKTTNSVSISNTEESLSKLSLINESQQGKGAGSTDLEYNSPSEATAKSLEDLSKGIPETTKDNEEGVFNFLGNTVSKDSADGLLEDLSCLSLETLKVNAEIASNWVEPSKEWPVVANEEKESQEDDNVHK
ncbi:PREDICTED: uncharacterized protein LOC109228749 [Nicotiana attenuata]|uniref:Uncharacterized protein n=1 Tax=Nicotiana attenuata TaxID=49451 RepID=A0A1J6IMW0_NICAT|nr:PREDICTED: uncharacterized protein LOC109228749 [Nicotiana attenuata]OIT00195.1 hypothetical protein A4A49_31694 [Nicotiana attenuata]